MLKDKLRELRKKKGLSQKTVADFLRIGRTAYTKYENGVHEPDNDTLRNLAVFYGVSIDTLLGSSENEMRIMRESMQKEILDIYDTLNETAKKRLLDYASDLVCNPTNQRGGTSHRNQAKSSEESSGDEC